MIVDNCRQIEILVNFFFYDKIPKMSTFTNQPQKRIENVEELIEMFTQQFKDKDLAYDIVMLLLREEALSERIKR